MTWRQKPCHSERLATAILLRLSSSSNRDDVTLVKLYGVLYVVVAAATHKTGRFLGPVWREVRETPNDLTIATERYSRLLGRLAMEQHQVLREGLEKMAIQKAPKRTRQSSLAQEQDPNRADQPPLAQAQKPKKQRRRSGAGTVTV